jgi:3-hydroxyisobutyrate dehydrogenase-like beta-hydroxyacid dehydrogenase
LQEVDNPYAVGQHSDILITMVVDESQTDTVLRGDGGALSSLDAGSVVIVMSTVSPEYCQALSAEALERGISVLDCPVSGGRGRAEQGHSLRSFVAAIRKRLTGAIPCSQRWAPFITVAKLGWVKLPS